MPTYLVHGFRWSRAMIRIHIILNDLEDAAAEWILAPATSICFLNSFYSLFDFLPPSNLPPPSYPVPGTPHEQVIVQDVQHLEPPRPLTQGFKNNLRRISSAAMLRGNNGNGFGGAGGGGGLKVAASEQNLRRPRTSAATPTAAPSGASLHSQATNSSSITPLGGLGMKKVDFNDWSVVKLVEQYDPDDMAVSQPFAYVADHMVKINLSVGITEEIAKYEKKVKEEEALLHEEAKGGSPVTIVKGSNGVDGHAVSPLAEERKSKRLNWFEKLRDNLEKDAEIGWYVVVCGDEERAVPSTGTSDLSYESEETDPQRTPTRKGLRGFFSRKKDSRDERIG